MWAKGHMSDTLPHFLFLQIKGHYEVPLKKEIQLNRLAYDNYNHTYDLYTITERLKITLQNILFHHSWLVEWSSHPHPESWIPVNLQATTENVSGYVCNHGSPSGERDTASPRGHYGERLQRDSCLKKHMKKHHPLAGDSPWRHYRRDHNIRTAGRIHHPLLRLKLASEAWPQSLGDAVSRSPLREPWLHT